MNLHIKMDDRASESFVFEGCMNESLYIQENGNFNCRQCEIIVDVDQCPFFWGNSIRSLIAEDKLDPIHRDHKLIGNR